MGIRLLHMFTIIFKNLRYILNAFYILHQGEYWILENKLKQETYYVFYREFLNLH